jgi:hypothetical protein
MPNFNGWLGDSTRTAAWLGTVDRGIDTARLIAEKPDSITVRRDGSDLAAQVVRLEPYSMPVERNGQIMTVSMEGVLITGYKGHPTISDTNIQRGDRFWAGDQEYDVIQVIGNLPDRLLAIAKAVD